MESPLAKPSRIGAYDIVDVIGRGGMGTVFRGNDPRIGRAVAIKMLTGAAEDPDLLVRFYREAKYTGSLHHQNIVTVYELGHQDGVPYLVMEFLEGVSLEAMIAQGRSMPVAEKLGIILQVCSGLSYAHKNGLVHRDIKPANIMILGDGTAKIVDFGIALLGGSRLTRTGHVVGSLNYMSPEQLSGNMEVDGRTDVYSTGVVLFQLLTGVLPFDGGSTAATLRRIVQDPPPRLSQYMADCPEELEAVLQKALVKNREERYASPDDFAYELEQVHQIYQKKIVGETLQHATDALQRKDFATARQQVLQVLKGAPANSEATELLRQIKAGQEQQQHEQQVLHLQMKAEEAFRKNRLDEAMQFVEHGMKLDPEGAVFSGLRDAIAAAQAQAGRYKEFLKRAEAALRAGDLESAKRAVEDAQQILPDDLAARTLATQIVTRLEQQLREQKAAEKQRQFARAVNAAEKGMADARMLFLLGQVQEALQALENMESDVAELPPRWVEQFAALKKEVIDKRDEQNRTDTQEWVTPSSEPADNPQVGEGQTEEIPVPDSATVMMQPGAGEEAGAPAEGSASYPVQPSAVSGTFPAPAFSTPEYSEPVSSATQFSAPAAAEAGRFAESSSAGSDAPYSARSGSTSAEADTSHDVLYPRGERTGEGERAEVAPELQEFLKPRPSTLWSRPTVWLGVAAVILVAVFAWIMLRPSSNSETKTAPTTPSVVVSSTYAEINAEPWATVTGVTPVSGDAQSAVGQSTPLRVKLPPGQYSVTLQGPNHEQKSVNVTVPQQGGASCFAVFKKPDVSRIVGKE